MPKTINELLNGSGPRLAALKRRSRDRALTLEQVRAALPPELAQAVVSAGVHEGRLTLGIAGAGWAARIRYAGDTLRLAVSRSSDTPILSVRIRVVAPAA